MWRFSTYKGYRKCSDDSPVLSTSLSTSFSLFVSVFPRLFKPLSVEMLSHSAFLALNPLIPLINPSSSKILQTLGPSRVQIQSPRIASWIVSPPIRASPISTPAAAMAEIQSCSEADVEQFVAVANKVADAAGKVIRKYFRQSFEILDKDDLSHVTIADRAAEESMISILLENFPSHAIFGEENGWRCKEASADYVWVLDPIDGTKSFITGKPVFCTLIALLHKGKPIVGIVDQPILRERWIGMSGKRTTLNGREISTRTCSELSQAYLYATSPHLFEGGTDVAFSRIRKKVKVSSYGCDCYAYTLLASGFVDLVIESGLKPYDFLSLVPVIQGAGGLITDWKGQELQWDPSSDSHVPSYNVAAAGDHQLHEMALAALEWQ